MEQNLFSKQQEEQLREHFEKIDQKLGIAKLDDNKDLEEIFNNYPARFRINTHSHRWYHFFKGHIKAFFAAPAYSLASVLIIITLSSRIIYSDFKVDHEIETKSVISDSIRGQNEIQIEVDNPRTAAQSLVSELVTEGIELLAEYAKEERVVLTIENNEKSRALLAKNRIYPETTKSISLIFEKSRK